MRLLVTGGAGSIGSEVVRQAGADVCAFDLDETRLYELERETGCAVWLGDVTLEHDVTAVFNSFRPDAVVHAAAYKHVPMGERFKSVIRRVNVGGTASVVAEAKAQGIGKLVLVSTDKAGGNSVMGVTKREAERLVVGAGYSALRLGNVLWSRGSVLPLWNAERLAGKPLSLTDVQMRRYFITAEAAAERILSTLELGAGLYVAEMGEPVDLIDLMVQAFPGCDYEVVGVRPGEALSEDVPKGVQTRVRGVLRVP